MPSALCPLPSALCPLPSALCPVPCRAWQVTIHTDTLNESGCLEETLAAFKVRHALQPALPALPAL